MSKNPTKERGILRRTASFLEKISASQVHLEQYGDFAVDPVDLDSEFTSDLQTESTNTATAAQTNELAYEIDA